MSLLNLLPHLVNGIALGLLFGLIALGFMLILGLMEQINLAHGSLFALGAYFAYADRHAAAAAASGTRRSLGRRAAGVAVRGGPPAGADPGGAVRAGARTPDAAHLRPRPALRAAAHLRRGHGAGGADPAGVGHARLYAARAARDVRRLHHARPDLVDLSLLGGGTCHRRHGDRLGDRRAHAVRGHGQGGRARQRDRAGAGLSILRGCGFSCSCSAPCWPPSRASSWRRCGASARTWASMRSCRPSSSSCWAASAASGAR